MKGDDILKRSRKNYRKLTTDAGKKIWAETNTRSKKEAKCNGCYDMKYKIKKDNGCYALFLCL